VPQRIVILAFDGCQPLDIVGPAEVFHGAEVMRPGSYDVVVASLTGGVVGGPGPVRLDTVALGALRGPVDTVVVPGAYDPTVRPAHQPLISAVAGLADSARRVTSVCSGALLLAAAGQLDGRRATTHWAVTDMLAQGHPEVAVQPDSIFVRDGNVWTSAGVTAGLDLALALVEEDLGGEVAREIARWLVMFRRRPGGQSQFSPHLEARTAETTSLRDVQDWLADHLDRDLSNAALADRAGMSERNFARRFREEIGVTPAVHVARLRVEAAKELLAQADTGLVEIARRCGFGTVETFHRTFHRATGTTPGRYREHFAAPTSTPTPTTTGV
jgi:transcriptional regulator GlxA family with amidase domain